MVTLSKPNYSLKTTYRSVEIYVRGNGSVRGKYMIKKRGAFSTIKLAKAKIDQLWDMYPVEMAKAYNVNQENG